MKTPEEKVQIYPLTKVLVSERNSRQPKESDPDVKGLAVSMKKSGQITPGIGRPHPKKKGYIELGAGARRRIAAAVAEMREYKVIVRPMTDAELDDVIVVENLQREDPHPRQVAAVMARRVKEGGSIAEMAERYGKPKKWVHRYTQLVCVIPAILDKWDTDAFRRIGVDAMCLIGSLPEDLQESLITYLRFRPITRADLTEHLACELARTDTAPFSLTDPRYFVEGCGPGCASDSANAPDLFEFKDEDKGKGKCSRCLNTGCFFARLQIYRDTEYDALSGEKKLRVVNRSRAVVTIKGEEYGHCFNIEPLLTLPKKKPKDTTFEEIVVIQPGGKLARGWIATSTAKEASGSGAAAPEAAKSVKEKREERVNMIQGRRWLTVRGNLVEAVQAAKLSQLTVKIDELVAVFGLPYHAQAASYSPNDGVWKALDSRKKGYIVGSDGGSNRFSTERNQIAKREEALLAGLKYIWTGLMPEPDKVGTAPKFENTYRRIAKLIGFDLNAAKKAADLLPENAPPKKWGEVNIHTLQPV